MSKYIQGPEQTCQHCGKSIVYYKGVGYVHRQGGKHVIIFCDAKGKMQADHIAEPRRDGNE
jgi:ribosomal protein L24E